jgi:hypothetical protein
MSQVDAKLVQMIADLVIEALSNHPRTADIRPPAGLCTAGPAPGSAKPAPAGLCTAGPGPGSAEPAPAVKPVTISRQADPKAVAPAIDRPHLRGIVTANQLSDAIQASPDNTVMLAMSARLTPLAQDIVRSSPASVRRENVSDQDATLKTLNYGLPWAWWTCGQCDAVRRTVTERAGMMIPLAVPRRPVSIAEAVMDADAAVRSRRAAGAVLFVSQAARAMCLSNRRRSLRAILGNCDEAVAQGVHEIGANLLVLEFPRLNYEQMSARVDTIMRSDTKPPIEMTRFLSNVEGAGL